ncbi:hypothetical protein N0V90_006478 [Kalmusia sp. IMI 367209]|nr:hypothetical protein N0V90_006478 [Kalmusia sp. IMI 367209]
MPRLHAQIRNVTNTKPIPLQSEHVIEPEANAEEDVGRGLRKQMRIEKIANQYIKLGRVPLILSAQLRGPFDNGWKNPWTQAPLERTKKEAVRSVNVGGRATSRTTHASATQKPIRESKTNLTKSLSSMPSLETSRGPLIAQDSVLPPEDNHHEPPTLQQDHSGATEFFSIDPDQSFAADCASKTNASWLRRPSLKSVGFGKSTSGNSDPSPTRTRHGYKRVDGNGRLRLASPRQPLNVPHSGPGDNAALEPECKSSAPASMVITSHAKPTEILQQGMKNGDSSKRKRTPSIEPTTDAAEYADAPKAAVSVTSDSTISKAIRRRDFVGFPMDVPKHSPVAVGSSNAYVAPSFTPINATSRNRKSSQSNDTVHPAPTERGSCISEREVYAPDDDFTYSEHRRAITNDQILEDHQAPALTTDPVRRVLREDIHASVKKCGQGGSSSRSDRRMSKKRKSTKDTAFGARHNHVASPTFASSTGFTYRKVGETKQIICSSKLNPRLHTLDSPAVIENQSNTEAAHQELHAMNKPLDGRPTPTVEMSPQGFRLSRKSRRPDVYTVPRSPQELQDSYKSRRTSGISTQAALMLARMEFQEGTVPAVATDQPASWFQPQDDILQQNPDIPSPAITPFHQFNAALEEDCPHEASIRDMSISTQDLFAAASPFAFSTVKKSTRPQTSNLRFSVFASGGQDGHDSHQNGAKSPTPSERVPLKEKNRVSFLGSQSEKGSQDSTPRRSKSTAKAVELPQLEFPTSLDDPRPNSDLDFTDRFLLNLNGKT